METIENYAQTFRPSYESLLVIIAQEPNPYLDSSLRTEEQLISYLINAATRYFPIGTSLNDYYSPVFTAPYNIRNSGNANIQQTNSPSNSNNNYNDLNSNTLASAQRVQNILKEKRLAKFFGQKLTTDQINRQIQLRNSKLQQQQQQQQHFMLRNATGLLMSNSFYSGEAPIEQGGVRSSVNAFGNLRQSNRTASRVGPNFPVLPGEILSALNYGEQQKEEQIRLSTNRAISPNDPEEVQGECTGAAKKDNEDDDDELFQLLDESSASEVNHKATQKIYARKKKVDKLNEFFGDKLSKGQLKAQYAANGTNNQTENNNERGNTASAGNLINTSTINTEDDDTSSNGQSEFNNNNNSAYNNYENGNSEDDEQVAMVPMYPTTNTIPMDQKLVLAKRNKKLQGYFGAALAENVIQNNLVLPARLLRQKSNPNNDTKRESSHTSMMSFDSSMNTSMVNSAAPSRKSSNPLLAEDPSQNQSSPDSNSANGGASSSSKQQHASEKQKELRRKKAEKLQQFLGERLNQRILELQSQAAMKKALIAANSKSQGNSNNNGIQSPKKEDKMNSIRRANKLEKMFGALPPSDLVLLTSNNVNPERKSILGLKLLLNSDTDMAELLSIMEEDDENYDDGDLGNFNGNGIIGGPGESGSAAGSPVVGSDNGTPKTQRQRKLNKLRNFFGDGLTTSDLIEQRILRYLEESIEEKYTGKDLDQLKIDLDTVRARVHGTNIEEDGGDKGSNNVPNQMDNSENSLDDSSPVSARRNPTKNTHLSPEMKRANFSSSSPKF